MSERDLKIFSHLKKDVQHIKDNEIEWVAVMLQGSQNYNLDDEESDIDTKAITLPSFEDFCLNKQPLSRTHVNEDNSHLDLKDLRLMIQCWRKQNVNFLEVLFTNYYIVNKKYMEEFNKLKKYNEQIAHYNNYAAINTMYGMCMQKHKALEHPYPSTKDKIEKYGFDGKQLSHMFRLKEFADRYAAGVPYAQCLISNLKNYLIAVKRNQIYNLESARFVANQVMDNLKEFRENYFLNTPLKVDEEVDKVFKEVTVSVMKKNFGIA